MMDFQHLFRLKFGVTMLRRRGTDLDRVILLLLILSCWNRIQHVSGQTPQNCDPSSGRLLDPDKNTPLPDGSGCTVGEFCKESDPLTVPPTGACSPQLKYGETCTKNAACSPGTTVEAKKFICNKKAGAKEGKCGCLLDYMTAQEKEDHKFRLGYVWEQDAPGKGCVKKIEPNRACNPQTEDVCAVTATAQTLVCRSRDGRSGNNFCLFEFATRGEGMECYDNSDCQTPKRCIVVDKKAVCGCPPGERTPTNNPLLCIPMYVGYKIQCEDDQGNKVSKSCFVRCLDCLPEWNIHCNKVSGTSICTCKDDTDGVTDDDGKKFEYFPQNGGHDRCYEVQPHNEPCSTNNVLTSVGWSHNCRRINTARISTNMICNSDPDKPGENKCMCERDHFKWKEGRCAQLYAWFGEVCETDSDKVPENDPTPVPTYRCDSKLQLTCAIPGYTCACIPGAQLLPNLRKACKLGEELQALGQTCDDMSKICNSDLHLACVAGVCACVVDPAIVFDRDAGLCRFTNNRQLLSSCPTPVRRDFVVAFTLILVQILNYCLVSLS